MLKSTGVVAIDELLQDTLKPGHSFMLMVPRDQLLFRFYADQVTAKTLRVSAVFPKNVVAAQI